MHAPALRVPVLHLPVPRLTRRCPPSAAVLLTVVYAAAITVALTTPAQHALAGCVVLAGATARWAARRHRSAAGAVAAATAAVDALVPDGGALADVPAPAPAPTT